MIFKSAFPVSEHTLAYSIQTGRAVAIDFIVRHSSQKRFQTDTFIRAPFLFLSSAVEKFFVTEKTTKYSPTNMLSA